MTQNAWKFPDDEHVEKVCKPDKGAATCRYLAMGADGWSCEKGTSNGQYIDERVTQGTMRAQGDNCGGILEFLCDGRLVGMRVHHEESMPTFEADGTVERLAIEGEMLVLHAKWDGGQEVAPSIALGYINISHHGPNVVISCAFPMGHTWTFEKASSAPSPSLFLTLPTDEVRVAQLRAKLEEYRGRLERDCRGDNPSRAWDSICKIAVLETLLNNGRVDLSMVREKLAHEHGEAVGRLRVAFEVIADYCTTGGRNTSSGTGLPDPATLTTR